VVFQNSVNFIGVINEFDNLAFINISGKTLERKNKKVANLPATEFVNHLEFYL